MTPAEAPPADIINLNTLIALGALMIAGIAMFMKWSDKSLSLREHQEFKETTRERLESLTAEQKKRLEIREFTEWREQVNRDFDRLEADLRIIDETKPSAETLEEAMRAITARVSHLEAMIRELKINGRNAG